MTDNKVFTWEKRQAVKYTGPYHHGYFFRKSFEDCSGTAMKALAQDMLTTTEKKYEVEYTKDAQNLIAKCSVEPLQDPLLKAVFGPNSHIEQKALLDFYERNAVMHEKDAMAFVDLCVILGELERAEKFADRVKKDFEILRILKQSNGKIQSEVLRHESIKMWLEKAQKNFNVARLASLIHRLAESANGESLLRVTSELWGEGYYWDAMCLVAILTPEEATVLNFMKENIPRFLKEKDCSPLLEILNTLKSAESNSEGPVTIYNNDQLKFLDAGTVFRLIKIDICRNEKDTQSDIEKLGVRTKCSEALRFVLLTALAQFGPVEARMMAEDLMAYMRKNFPNALSDYFPNAERMLFESFIGMIADVYSAVCCVLSVVSSSTVDFEKAQKFGITNVIMAKWRRDYPNIWKDTGIWPRNSFASTCHTLLNHLAFLDHILGSHNDIKGKMLKYTLRICCLFAAPEFTPLRADRRLFSDIAEEFGIPAEHSNKIGNAFAYAEPVEVAEHPVNGPTTPVHLTPDQLISSIKSQGVDPPPLPEVDRLPLSKAASTTLVSESNVTKDVSAPSANSAEVQEEPPVVKEKVEEPREEKNKEEPPVEKTEEKPVVAKKVHEEPLKKSKEVKPQSELQVKASGLVLEPKAAESMDFVPSGVKRAVARENMTAVSSPRHASPAFSAPVETLSTPDLGRVVPIVSEDGVNMMGVLEDEEMETKWEISRQELAEIIGSKHSSPGGIAQNSQESVTPVAEGSVTARSPVDQEKDQFGREGSFASKAADWNQVVQERAIETSSEAPSLNSTVDDVSPLDHSTPIVSQENLPPIHAPPSSPAETPVVCNAVSATAVQKGLNETVFAEGRLKTSSATLPKDSESSLKNQEDKQVDQQQPPTDPTPPTQASLVVAQVSTPNALDNLLSGSMKASGDASSIAASEGSGSEKNIASSSSGCPEDVAGASVCAVRSFAVGTPAISPPPSYTVAAAPPPAYSSAPKQRFNTGGFDQSGGGGFGSFGSFGSSSGVSSGGERRNTGYSGGAPSGGGRYGQPPGGQRSGGQHGGPHHGPGGGGGQYGGHRGAGGHGGRGDGGRRNFGGGGGRGHGGGQSRGHQY